MAAMLKVFLYRQGFSSIFELYYIFLRYAADPLMPDRKQNHDLSEMKCPHNLEEVDLFSPGAPEHWYEAYDMFDVVHPQTILAYGMNGKDLPLGNGAPVRLRVERHCGYKNLKFVKSIQVVSSVEDIRRGTGGINSDNDWHWYAGA